MPSTTVCSTASRRVGQALPREAARTSTRETPRARTRQQFWAYCGLGIVTRSSSDWVQTSDGRWARAEVQRTRGLNRIHNRMLKAVFKGAGDDVTEAPPATLRAPRPQASRTSASAPPPLSRHRVATATRATRRTPTVDPRSARSQHQEATPRARLHRCADRGALAVRLRRRRQRRERALRAPAVRPRDVALREPRLPRGVGERMASRAWASCSRSVGSFARFAMTTSAIASGTCSAVGIDVRCGGVSWICETSTLTACSPSNGVPPESIW